MELRHIKLDNLKPTNVNVRHGKAAPDISDILPSIRKRGILQPLLVRPNGKGYEVVAGRRRYFAAKALQKDGEKVEPIPCAIMAKGDDAAAIEASLLENIARLPMDPMQQYEAFARLIKQGDSIGNIAETFGITELAVKRTLALAGLLPAIKALYGMGDFDGETLRILTLASKAQQKEWLALVSGKKTHAPTGYQLKRWLLGGDNIKTSQALFDLAKCKGTIVTDLFGDDDYFAEPEQFWVMQMEAIEQRVQTYKEDGWTGVEVFEQGHYFSEWEYEKTGKEDGGRIYITINQRGDVTFHEGFITLKEARSRKANGKGETDKDRPPKPEIPKAMQTYLELHRHALVRTELLSHPKVALRLTVAHMIAGSSLWQVRPEPQRVPKPEIKTSVLDSTSHQAFENERTAILKLLGFNKDRADLVRCNGDSYPTAMLFVKLLTTKDADVSRILTFAMVESLEAGSCLIEAIGNHFAIDATNKWQADDLFIDLLKDKKAINAVLANVANEKVAEANIKETGKVQKSIISDFIKGENGRKKRKNWLPKYLQFPFKGHTDIPIETISIGASWLRVKAMFKGKRTGKST
ncbi:MAG: ParB/RepB/Spo0J family partition protein [Robiginitomaculum sp.]|nr:ParB/RepB/Spo0J family partition protein [Robiginitomaculum sp.]